MNTNHYPQLELCKKLTEIGFPKTEKIIQLNTVGFQAPQSLSIPLNFGVCPSVMEMLDVMPEYIKIEGKVYNLYIHKGREYSVYWESDPQDIAIIHFGTLSNALANNIKWLKENNYITLPTNE